MQKQDEALPRVDDLVQEGSRINAKTGLRSSHVLRGPVPALPLPGCRNRVRISCLVTTWPREGRPPRIECAREIRLVTRISHSRRRGGTEALQGGHERADAATTQRDVRFFHPAA